MIQEYLSDKLSKELPDLEWTVDYFTSGDNTGTVYADQGSAPDVYDTEYRYPSYQVFIRSSDWDYAKKACETAQNVLHKLGGLSVKENGKSVYVLFLEAQSEPLRLGVKDRIMEYSINFDATLIKQGG